jgi:hypothetical protein
VLDEAQPVRAFPPPRVEGLPDDAEGAQALGVDRELAAGSLARRRLGLADRHLERQQPPDRRRIARTHPYSLRDPARSSQQATLEGEARPV